MDFFEHQDRAKSNTGKLIVFFCLGVLCIIASVYFLLSFVLGNAEGGSELAWTLELAVFSSIITIIVVGLASLCKTSQLSSGGAAVADALGGRLISARTKIPQERRVLNVVEEMALASGTPVPPVYLMDEPSINAFAAGFSPQDAVIGVTKGCISKLSRDQLQGVMAHEFSHILNGDMRINIRLTGIIFGIVFLSTVGEILMRSAGGSRRRRSKDDGGGALLVIGLGLFLIGLIGGFFGSLIRAAVSRQREFLADAAAVQFTRNPDGISGALKRIGGYTEGSEIGASGAKDFCHMFFGSAMNSLFATHPPLPKRIRRIEPNWNNTYPATDKIKETFNDMEGSQAVAGFAGGSAASEPAPAAEPVQDSPDAQTFLQNATQPGEEQIEVARRMKTEIAEELLEQAREPFGARCLLFAMLIDPDRKEVSRKQLELIRSQAEPGTVELTEWALPAIAPLSSGLKFVLIEEASPALWQLSSGQFETFQAITEQLIGADDKIDLLEWSLRKVIERDLGGRHAPSRRLHGSVSVRRLLNECSVILGALAHYGQEGADPTPAFETGMKALTRTNQPALPSVEKCGLLALDEAIARLEKLAPMAKKSLLDACCRTIDHDGRTSEIEIQILRGLAASISCPLSPSVLPKSSSVRPGGA